MIAILGGLSGVRWRLPVFESVLNSDRIASGGVKTGALLATFVHAGLIAGAVFLSGRAIVGSRPPEDIPPLIVLKNPGNSGGAGQSTASKEASPAPARHRRPARMVQTGAVIAKKVSPVEAGEDIPADCGPFAGAIERIVRHHRSAGRSARRGGYLPGWPLRSRPVGPYTPGPADPGTRTMGPGMSPPRLVDPGEQLQYTRQASEARVKGVMQVQCILTSDGRVRNCIAISPIPFREAAVLKSLMSRRYTPVLFEGRPVPVKYNFAITLKAAE